MVLNGLQAILLLRPKKSGVNLLKCDLLTKTHVKKTNWKTEKCLHQRRFY